MECVQTTCSPIFSQAKNENNDNEEGEGRDIFIRSYVDADSKRKTWERVEGIAPTHSPKICVGDIVRVKWKGYHDKKHTTSVVKIVDFKLGSYLDRHPIKFEVIQQVRIVDIKLGKKWTSHPLKFKVIQQHASSNIEFISPPYEGAKPERQITANGRKMLSNISIETSLTNDDLILFSDGTEYTIDECVCLEVSGRDI